MSLSNDDAEAIKRLKESLISWRNERFSYPLSDLLTPFLNKHNKFDSRSLQALLDDQELNQNVDPNILKTFFSGIDMNRDGAVTPEELEDFMYPPRDNLEIIENFFGVYNQALERGFTCQDLFDRIDEDGNGFIGLSELRDNVPLIGLRFTNTESKLVMSIMDIDQDGCISLQDFEKFIHIKVLHEPNLEHEFMGDKDHDKTTHTPHESQKLSLSQEFQSEYSDIARTLRSAILKNSDGIKSAKIKLRKAFQNLDTDGNGTVSTAELRDLILNICDLGEDARADSILDLLIQQIDINGDGVVTIDELEAFLYPVHQESQRQQGKQRRFAGGSEEGSVAREIGIVLLHVRKGLQQCLLDSNNNPGSDEEVLEAFAALGPVKMNRGLLDMRSVRKVLTSLPKHNLIEFLEEEEVDGLCRSLDQNGDGVLSAREFVKWLFPTNRLSQQNTPRHSDTDASDRDSSSVASASPRSSSGSRSRPSSLKRNTSWWDLPASQTPRTPRFAPSVGATSAPMTTEEESATTGAIDSPQQPMAVAMGATGDSLYEFRQSADSELGTEQSLVDETPFRRSLGEEGERGEEEGERGEEGDGDQGEGQEQGGGGEQSVHEGEEDLMEPRPQLHWDETRSTFERTADSVDGQFEALPTLEEEGFRDYREDTHRDSLDESPRQSLETEEQRQRQFQILAEREAPSPFPSPPTSGGKNSPSIPPLQFKQMFEMTSDSIQNSDRNLHDLLSSTENSDRHSESDLDVDVLTMSDSNLSQALELHTLPHDHIRETPKPRHMYSSVDSQGDPLPRGRPPLPSLAMEVTSSVPTEEHNSIDVPETSATLEVGPVSDSADYDKGKMPWDSTEFDSKYRKELTKSMLNVSSRSQDNYAPQRSKSLQLGLEGTSITISMKPRRNCIARHAHLITRLPSEETLPPYPKRDETLTLDKKWLPFSRSPPKRSQSLRDSVGFSRSSEFVHTTAREQEERDKSMILGKSPLSRTRSPQRINALAKANNKWQQKVPSRPSRSPGRDSSSSRYSRYPSPTKTSLRREGKSQLNKSQSNSGQRSPSQKIVNSSFPKNDSRASLSTSRTKLPRNFHLYDTRDSHDFVHHPMDAIPTPEKPVNGANEIFDSKSLMEPEEQDEGQGVEEAEEETQAKNRSNNFENEDDVLTGTIRLEPHGGTLNNDKPAPRKVTYMRGKFNEKLSDDSPRPSLGVMPSKGKGKVDRPSSSKERGPVRVVTVKEVLPQAALSEMKQIRSKIEKIAKAQDGQIQESKHIGNQLKGLSNPIKALNGRLNTLEHAVVTMNDKVENTHYAIKNEKESRKKEVETLADAIRSVQRSVSRERKDRIEGEIYLRRKYERRLKLQEIQAIKQQIQEDAVRNKMLFRMLSSGEDFSQIYSPSHRTQSAERRRIRRKSVRKEGVTDDDFPVEVRDSDNLLGHNSYAGAGWEHLSFDERLSRSVALWMRTHDASIDHHHHHHRAKVRSSSASSLRYLDREPFLAGKSPYRARQRSRSLSGDRRTKSLNSSGRVSPWAEWREASRMSSEEFQRKARSVQRESRYTDHSYSREEPVETPRPSYKVNHVSVRNVQNREKRAVVTVTELDTDGWWESLMAQKKLAERKGFVSLA